MKRALISVWNKDYVVELAKFLVNQQFEIISTGGTKKILLENNIKVTSISEVTNFNEIMDGRVKTLHPKIYRGILEKLENKNHKNEKLQPFCKIRSICYLQDLIYETEANYELNCTLQNLYQN
mgnify:CR=1 FL=1